MSLKTNRFQLIATQQCVAIFLCKYFVKSKKSLFSQKMELQL